MANRSQTFSGGDKTQTSSFTGCYQKSTEKVSYLLEPANSTTNATATNKNPESSIVKNFF